MNYVVVESSEDVIPENDERLALLDAEIAMEKAMLSSMSSTEELF